MTVDLAEFTRKILGINESLKFMDSTFTDLEYLKSSQEISHKMELLCFATQAYFFNGLKSLDPSADCKVDRWLKPNDCGGGVTCVIQNGRVIEKGGVNVSVITGIITKEVAIQMKARDHLVVGEGDSFKAIGISSVIHPLNPHCPTVHFNYRYFEITPSDRMVEPIWWFGGGCDLTPYYIYTEDVVYFHQHLKKICDAHDPTYHLKFKKWADDYFFIPHRNERRGVGGIFFDDLNDKDAPNIFKFVLECALSSVPSYIPILSRRMNDPYTTAENEWKLIRRGRYVEFNVMYDRGTKFGLNVPGSRIESILMSLPLYAKWEYCHSPQPNSKEAELLKYTREPIDWASILIGVTNDNKIIGSI